MLYCYSKGCSILSGCCTFYFIRITIKKQIMKKLLQFVFVCAMLSGSSMVNAQIGYRMELVGKLRPAQNNVGYSALWGYVAPDNREYAILGSEIGTHIIDVTDSAVQVGFVETEVPGSYGNSWREMKVYSHYAYIVSEAEGSNIQIIDLQYLPDSVRYVGKFVLPAHLSTHTISQEGPYLYLNGANNSFGQGTVILDLSQNPEVPVLRGKWNTRYVHDSRIINDTIWACNIYTGEVTVINAQDKDNPVEITNWINAPNQFPHNIALTNDGKYAFTTDETDNPPGKLKVWNVEDLNNITLERIWNPLNTGNAIVHNIEIYDTIAVISYYTAGIRVIDISDPVNFTELAWYDTYPQNNNNIFDGCWAVYMFPSGKIIGSDITSGLYVVNIAPPSPDVPVCDFFVNNTSIVRGDSILLIDASSGVPTSWQWTITGPETFTSTLQFPSFVFNLPGSYNVKLRVSNSFGSDSLIKNSYIHVNGASMNSFSINGQVLQTVHTSPGDTSQYFYSWTSAGQHGFVDYKIKLKNTGGQQEYVFGSHDNGFDTFIGFRRSLLDSLSEQMNPLIDSSRVTVNVWAYNGTDSIKSLNAQILTIKRTKFGISQVATEIPEKYNLSQNYPNPFNPVTNIRFDIMKEGNVKLSVYDITGKEVSVLTNEVLKPGSYEVGFDASHLSSGVYYYRIEAGEFVSVKRMVLLK